MPGVTGRPLTGVLLGTAMTAAILTTIACSGASPRSGSQGEQAAKGPTCDQDAARGMLTLMSDPRMAKITEQDERVIVRFGKDYTNLTPAQREALTINFAAADSCLHKQVRAIEFQTPSGEVIAKADTGRTGRTL